MAVRGAPMRRTPEGPLAGVLRDMRRQTVKTSAARPTQGPAGPPGPPGPPAPAPAAGTVTTGEDGRATWRYSSDGRPPVVTATPVQPPGVDGPVRVVLERVEPGAVTVRVWADRPVTVLGVLAARPTGGVVVHLTATSASPVR